MSICHCANWYIIAFAFLFVTCCLSAFAQKFIIDPLFDDSVKCILAVKKDSVWDNAEPFKQVKFAKGTEIESCGPAEGYYVAFEHQGRHYMVFKEHLKFSDDNPVSMVNPLEDKVVKKHGSVGHFYATMTPVIMVLILMAIILLSYGLTLLSDRFSKATVIAIPAALLCISAIEVVGYLTLGGDVFWWCDNDRYGFFGSLLRLIPFGLVVAMQFYSIRMFEAALFSREPADSDKKISLKPAALSLACCLPVIIVYGLVVQVWLGWTGTVSDIIFNVLFLCTLLSGIVISAVRNISTMGTVKGLSISVFSIIYLIGLLVAVWGVLVVFVQLIFQVLMVMAAIIAIAMVGKPRYYRGSDGHIYSDSGFESMHRVD